jgi:putative acyl-CoA dehydrogenase
MCLDVLRALARGADEGQAVLAELGREAAELPGARDAVAFVTRALGSGDEAQSRAAVERLGALAAAAALARGAPAGVAEAFARTRLAGRAGLSFGTADLSAASAGELLERALPG